MNKIVLVFCAVMLVAACREDVNHTGIGEEHRHVMREELDVRHTHECGNIPHAFEEHYALRKDCLGE